MNTHADGLHVVAPVVEIVGIAIIVAASFGALAMFLVRTTDRATTRTVQVAAFRFNLGRAILLGLDFSSPRTSSIPSPSSRRRRP